MADRPAMPETEVRQRLRSWIIERAKHRPSELRDDTPLLGTGLLVSLDVVQLIVFIEELKGEEVDADDVGRESIGTVDAIYRTFFG